jgi:hypothetical protein
LLGSFMNRSVKLPRYLIGSRECPDECDFHLEFHPAVKPSGCVVSMEANPRSVPPHRDSLWSRVEIVLPRQRTGRPRMT